ncbi:MAG: permease, partial [Clostridia bacterium]
ETLWALVLGFGLSGAVQAFVSKENMQRTLGNHRPAAVARASGFGAMSSSCSYAASAMAKSLFQKGADFVAAMVFMVASTNLVIELGLVLLVLIGWQFAAAEFVGGPLMIVLLALVGGLVFRGPLVETARRGLTKPAARSEARTGGSPAKGAGGADRARREALDEARGEHQRTVEQAPWATKLRSKGAWADAATYAIADVTMLRKELVIGYTVAGFLAALVPATFWAALFVTGHGGWTSVENAAIGPLIAVVSWVCSVGNVPLAAALWKGGISFGGVISFVFADLISMPLILIYRKFYGWRLTLRLVLVFYVVMAIAGLAVGELFSAVGLVPTVRRASVVAVDFSWNYTSVLNIVFLMVFVGLLWMKRHREQLGGGAGFAIDPVCGMQVRIADAPAEATWDGKSYWFCSDRCRVRFEAEPERFTGSEATTEPMAVVSSAIAGSLAAVGHGDSHTYPTKRAPTKKEDTMDQSISPAERSNQVVDPVCHMTIDPEHAAAHRRYRETDYYFCNPGCAEAFDADPARYAQP